MGAGASATKGSKHAVIPADIASVEKDSAKKEQTEPKNESPPLQKSDVKRKYISKAATSDIETEKKNKKEIIDIDNDANEIVNVKLDNPGSGKSRRRSSITILSSNLSSESHASGNENNGKKMFSLGGQDRKISFVLKRNADSTSGEESNKIPPVHEELDEQNKLEVLRFATEISLNTDIPAILTTVDRIFKRVFRSSKVVIYLNPDYASRYNRFLRKHSNNKKKKKNSPERLSISSLEIGFEDHLGKLCGLRSLSYALQTREPIALSSSTSSSSPSSPSSPNTCKGKDGEKLSDGDEKNEIPIKEGTVAHDKDQNATDKDADDGMYSLGCPIFSLLEHKYPDQNLGGDDDLYRKQSVGLSVPRKNIIAVCEINRQNDEITEPFSEDDAKLLAALSIHLGQALERACIESDLSKHLEWSRMMLKMAETLNSALDSVELIETAIKMLRAALFAERGSMYLVDDTKSPPDLWTMVTGSDTDCDELRELRIPFGKGIAGAVAENEEVIMIPDAYQDERFNPAVDRLTGLKTTSILCVPVFSSTKKLVAVIQMINKRATDGGWDAAFDDDDVEILRSFSSHVSVALNNAKVTAKNKYNEEIANQLLDKMFPQHITEKLKRINEMQALSKAQNRKMSLSLHQPIVEKYPRVFVFFSDIVSFTTLSMQWEPTDVVNLLNDLFTQLDLISAKHSIYKLETIGDAYVACSGLPFLGDDEQTAARNLANFALEAQEMTKTFLTRTKKQIQIRAGMHCGPCFGGVVGLKMPRYCLMGDTMNTASRMESTGCPGKVHISEDFKLAIDDLNEPSEFECEDLGTKPVKGKGDMRTYFLYRGGQKIEQEHGKESCQKGQEKGEEKEIEEKEKEEEEEEKCN